MGESEKFRYMKDITILVIEDDALNMKLVRSLLQLKNYTVLEAENAEVGVKIARRFKPDMILMDIQLPGMDGIEATKLLLNDNELKKRILENSKKTVEQFYPETIAKKHLEIFNRVLKIS